MKLLHTIDRASAQLDGQLLSSTTSGSFSLSNLSILGSQDWDTPSGEQAILTINNEQILCTLAESGGTLTATIATNGRGYNGTSAATHDANDYAYIRMTSAHYELIKDEVASHVQGIIAYEGTTPTVTSSTVLTVASSNETAKFTPGRVVLYKISSTWYRAVVRSSSFSTNTTVNISGDGLPGSGTITSIGFEMQQSVNKAINLQLNQDISGNPAENPPSGYAWIYTVGGQLRVKNDAGTVVALETVSPPVATGAILPYGGRTAPTGYLLCDGSAVSRSTYSALFAILSPTLGTFTVTIATPGVVTLSSHGLQTGDSIYLTTTGALPTGLSANTRYWVIKNDANTFWLATSLSNALAATKIDTSGSQSGTHTAKAAGYGIGDGSTTFNVPDMQGRIPAGRDSTDAVYFGGIGETGGEKTHVLTVAELAAHSHTAPVDNSGTSGTSRAPANTNGAGTPIATTSAGSDAAHNNVQPYNVVNYIIKT